jgi:hypothetical protein
VAGSISLAPELSYSPTLGQISGLFKLQPAPADRFPWYRSGSRRAVVRHGQCEGDVEDISLAPEPHHTMRNYIA